MRFALATPLPPEQCRTRLKAMTWYRVRGPLRCRVTRTKVLAALQLSVRRRLLLPVAVCRFEATEEGTRVTGTVRPQTLELLGLIIVVVPLTAGWYPTLHAMLLPGFAFAGVFAWAFRSERPSYERERAILVRHLCAVLEGQVE